MTDSLNSEPFNVSPQGPVALLFVQAATSRVVIGFHARIDKLSEALIWDAIQKMEVAELTGPRVDCKFFDLDKPTALVFVDVAARQVAIDFHASVDKATESLVYDALMKRNVFESSERCDWKWVNVKDVQA